MKKILIFLLCGVMLLSLTACKKSSVSNTPEEEEYPEMYVEDLAVNRFLLDFKERTGITPQGLGRGTVSGEYSLSVNLCEVRLLSTENGLRISILSGNTQEDMDRLLFVFEKVCKAADTSLTAGQLANAKDYLNKQTETVGNYRISNYLKILAFTPLVNVETVKLDCKIDLLAMNYLPVNEE